MSAESPGDTLDMQARANEAARQAGVTWMQAEARAASHQLVPDAGAGVRPDMVETNESALRRSLDAESALQAEVAVLRERSAQLQTRLDEQRRVFVTGVQQMMRPLQDYFAERRLAVPFEALIPRMMQELGLVQDLSARVVQLQEEAKTLRRPAHVNSKAPETFRLEALMQAVASLQARVGELEDARGAVAHSQNQVPESYDTFVMSDLQSADIERAILDAQTRGRSFPG